MQYKGEEEKEIRFLLQTRGKMEVTPGNTSEAVTGK